MLTRQLPEQINIRKLADHSGTLEGVVDVRRLERLSQALLSDEGQVVVSLEFFRNDNGIKVVTGTVRGVVPLECQRCLEPVNTEIEVDINLAVVKSEEQAENLESKFEPLILEDDQVQLVDIIEDDLLLVLPMIPSHDIEICIQNGYEPLIEDEGEVIEEVPSESSRENPFAVLADLKKKD